MAYPSKRTLNFFKREGITEEAIKLIYNAGYKMGLKANLAKDDNPTATPMREEVD